MLNLPTSKEEREKKTKENFPIQCSSSSLLWEVTLAICFTDELIYHRIFN
jgi:hypothetical protein